MEREVKQLEEMEYFKLPNVTVFQPDSALSGELLNWSDNFELYDTFYNKCNNILNGMKGNI